MREVKIFLFIRYKFEEIFDTEIFCNDIRLNNLQETLLNLNELIVDEKKKGEET